MLQLWVIYADEPGPRFHSVEITKNMRRGALVDDAFMQATASNEIGGRR